MLAQSTNSTQGQTSQQSFMPQQQGFQSGRNGNRGRNFNKFPRDPCAICGRNNHTTNYCYYKGQMSQVYQPPGQWGNVSYQSSPYQSSPWMSPMQHMMNMPQIPMSQQFPLVNGFFGMPSTSGLNLGGHQSRPQFSSSQAQFNTPQAHFAVDQGFNLSQAQYTTPQANLVTPQANFTGSYNVQNMTPSSSIITPGLKCKLLLNNLGTLTVVLHTTSPTTFRI